MLQVTQHQEKQVQTLLHSLTNSGAQIDVLNCDDCGARDATQIPIQTDNKALFYLVLT